MCKSDSNCSEDSVEFEFYFDYGLDTKGGCMTKSVTASGH